MSAHFPLSGKPSEASVMCHLLLSLPKLRSFIVTFYVLLPQSVVL